MAASAVVHRRHVFSVVRSEAGTGKYRIRKEGDELQWHLCYEFMFAALALATPPQIDITSHRDTWSSVVGVNFFKRYSFK